MDQELTALNNAIMRSYEESYEFISGEISPVSLEHVNARRREVSNYMESLVMTPWH